MFDFLSQLSFINRKRLTSTLKNCGICSRKVFLLMLKKTRTFLPSTNTVLEVYVLNLRENSHAKSFIDLITCVS